MSIRERTPAISMNARTAFLYLLLISTYAAAQDASPMACPSPEVVLQRYVDAVGGEAAVEKIESRVAEAKAIIHSPEPFPMVSDTQFSLQWKAPNKVAVTGLGAWFAGGKATWRFDGKLWYSPNGANSLENRSHRGMYYQINMMYRLAADPLMMARAHAFYGRFEAAESSPGRPGLCVLKARRPGTPAHGIFAFESSSSCKDCLAPLTDGLLPDEFYFDAQSGLLKKWRAHEGWVSPGYVEFQFDDYRETGTVRIPFHVHVEFGILKATFLYTTIRHNVPLEDSVFSSQ
ncbi:MAG TPA: hypothetical protein VF532_11395 [Candidatus Angelobacter sp.]